MTCIVCEIELKDMQHWKKHMNSLLHKDNLHTYSMRKNQETQNLQSTMSKNTDENDEFEIPKSRKIKPDTKNSEIDQKEEILDEKLLKMPNLPEVFFYRISLIFKGIFRKSANKC